MKSKPIKKENAKTRYDAKKPTVSFRVSKEEYARLDALKKDSVLSFRDIVLTGARMIEKDRARERKRRADEKKKLEEAVKAARIDALSCVRIGTCPTCHKPMYWNLNRTRNLNRLTEAVYRINYCHPGC
ncbi:MAG: hypothetical protein NT131_06035 [Methanomassiliicoccales archaeon]|nr:hypothetical protein [Methanomassiliicoccales archaeon]